MKEVYFTAWLFSKPQVLRWPVARANQFLVGLVAIDILLNNLMVVLLETFGSKSTPDNCYGRQQDVDLSPFIVGDV
jgi:hypothetical protein